MIQKYTDQFRLNSIKMGWHISVSNKKIPCSEGIHYPKYLEG